MNINELQKEHEELKESFNEYKGKFETLVDYLGKCEIKLKPEECEPDFYSIIQEETFVNESESNDNSEDPF